MMMLVDCVRGVSVQSVHTSTGGTNKTHMDNLTERLVSLSKALTQAQHDLAQPNLTERERADLIEQVESLQDEILDIQEEMEFEYEDEVEDRRSRGWR